MQFLLKTKNRIDQRTDAAETTINDNNSNENRNKTRRDHDTTMATAMNNKLLAELKGWSDKGDNAP